MIPKFRAWDKRFSEFVEDFFVSEDGKIYKKSTDTGYGIAISRETSDEVILMQSTGLKDKNGKEIFEGDILIVSDEHSWVEVVSYNQGKAMFVTEEINREFKVPETPLYDLFNTNIFKFEIVGNIYENPELLEVEE
nr:MAG TPA: YopX protein [Caudoviricetes sp.]